MRVAIASSSPDPSVPPVLTHGCGPAVDVQSWIRCGRSEKVSASRGRLRRVPSRPPPTRSARGQGAQQEASLAAKVLRTDALGAEQRPLHAGLLERGELLAAPTGR